MTCTVNTSTLSSPIGDETVADGFSDGFSGGDLLDDIDFGDIFNGFDDGDMLPDLELDPDEILAQFSIGGEDPGAAAGQASSVGDDQRDLFPEAQTREEDKCSSHGDEAVEKGGPQKSPTASSSSSEADRRRKPSAMPAKGSHGKRKVKVDWTPELHRRFVQAVEQLGVDKAVPSRILELMGIDCLTRHNIASHLQKYRSNRKHVLAREAEEASWSQKRLMYAAGGVAKRDINLQHPWLAPTMGFPPHPIPTFRPLHVWGHPSVEQPLVHVWPKHLVRPPPPPPWVVPQLPLPPLPPTDPSYWHTHFPRGPRDGWVPNVVTQGTPCYPQPMPAARFPAPPVQGVPPHPLYKPPSSNHSSSQPQPQLMLDTHQSKESVDSAIGDVLAKPWLPLPLGLKPPSLESVLVELQRQGVSKIPPACG